MEAHRAVLAFKSISIASEMLARRWELSRRLEWKLKVQTVMENCFPLHEKSFIKELHRLFSFPPRVSVSSSSNASRADLTIRIFHCPSRGSFRETFAEQPSPKFQDALLLLCLLTHRFTSLSQNVIHQN